MAHQPTGPDSPSAGALQGQVTMVVLMLVACVGFNAADCTWITSPRLYASSQRCADQAALLAGMERARAAKRSTFAYRFRCMGGPDDPGRWIAVVNGQRYPLDIADVRETP